MQLARSGECGAEEAVKLLARHWPDEMTYQLLLEVAKSDKPGKRWGGARTAHHERIDTLGIDCSGLMCEHWLCGVINRFCCCWLNHSLFCSN